ncbi:MAG: hypothetical protein N0C80_15655, partial [Candidatus Thiodiazotropha endolucinida]|nr:hypothetical protein [Candidatus Thiodiazotropha taylori]MCW4272342.1 hypothetical protein [Candidatus Thiodiazotropha endolucinida]
EAIREAITALNQDHGSVSQVSETERTLILQDQMVEHLHVSLVDLIAIYYLHAQTAGKTWQKFI